MWKTIKGYENYIINTKGQIRRIIGKYCPNGRILKSQISTNNYIQICLCKNGKAKMFRLHRLLAEAFLPNPANKPQVNHIDGNRKNNDLSNLEWVTVSENMLHAMYVTKNKLPSRSMLGKMGMAHNLSKSFSVEYPNGKIVNYGSGLEFRRMTGLDHTSISWARNKGYSSYKFVKGKMKGLIVYYENVLCGTI